MAKFLCADADSRPRTGPGRTWAISQEMVLNHVSQHVPGLPRSY
jgi:hypothetical protein